MSKTKVFISAIPFLGKKTLKDGTERDQLEAVKYRQVGNSRLAYECETRFPIVPVINGYAEDGDTIRVLAILTDGEKSNARNTQHNYRTYFLPEIDSIASAKKLLFSGVEEIHTQDNEGIDTQLKLFSDIADRINPGEDLYACISYGTKPMPIVLTMALNYAYKLKKDVTVGCTVYGRFPHIDEEPKASYIYDTTSLFYMDSIVTRLAEMKASDPITAIKLMLGIQTSEGVGYGDKL